MIEIVTKATRWQRKQKWTLLQEWSWKNKENTPNPLTEAVDLRIQSSTVLQNSALPSSRGGTVGRPGRNDARQLLHQGQDENDDIKIFTKEPNDYNS